MKKILKKGLCIISSLLIATIVVPALTVSAADYYKVTVQSAQGVFGVISDISKNYKPGEEFQLNIYARASKKISYAWMYVRFNSDALYVKSVEAGEATKNMGFHVTGADDQAFQTSNQCVYASIYDMWDGGDYGADYSTKKLLFTVSFTVKDAIAANQIIQVDFRSLEVSEEQSPVIEYDEEEGAYHTYYPEPSIISYINNGTVVENKKYSFSLTAEITGGFSEQQKVNITNWEVIGIKNKTYNGKNQTQSITVTDGEKNADISIKYYNNKDVGTATIAITGKGDYIGTIFKTFKINKAKQSMKVKVSKKTVRTKSLKKKAAVIKPITVRKAKGKVTYSKYKKGSTIMTYNRLSVNKKTGRITIKKNYYPKGTFKISVKIKAQGNKNYKSKTVTKTIKVNVK